MNKTLFYTSIVALLAGTSAMAFPLGNTGLDLHSQVDVEYNTTTSTTTTSRNIFKTNNHNAR